MTLIEQDSLTHDLRRTLKDVHIDLIAFYLSTDQQEKAKEITCITDNENLLGKMKYMGQQDTDSSGDVYRNISKLKKTTDKLEKYHIYEMNCKDYNRNHSSY